MAALQTTMCLFPALFISHVALAQNTTCATAVKVSAGSYWVGGIQGGDGFIDSPCHTTPGYGNDALWFMYSAPITGEVTVSSCLGAISMDSRLTIFTGTCGNLQCIAAADDNCTTTGPFWEQTASSVTFDVIAGITYYIEWDETAGTSAYQWTLTECVGTASGTTYVDVDADGVHDPGEVGWPMILEVDPGDQQFWSNGPYAHCSINGTYTITVASPPPHHVQSPAGHSYTVTTPDQEFPGLDFGFWPIPGIHDGKANVSYNWAWIGHVQSIHFQIRNIGTEPMTPTVTITLDPLQSYVGGPEPPTSVNGQELVWSWPTMAPGEIEFVSFTQYTSLDAIPYEPVVTYLELSIAEDDVDMSNNYSVLVVPARVGCDPNDKQVNEVTITPEDVADQKYLEYTVRFQNTGNAPASNVVVVDTLDADLDLSTFEMLGATHDHVLSINNGLATWAFPNIMLPDSTSDLEGSQGAFFYRVAPKTSLVLGDEITNRADIYFDFNEPVLTNTTVTVVALETDIPEPCIGVGLSVHPSPGSGVVTVRWASAQLNNARFSVLDALGRTVHTSSMNGSRANGQDVDLSFLPQGSYVARLTSDTSEASTRFVIQR